MSLNKVSLAEKFALFNDHWSPKIGAELNGQAVKFVKIQGEFVWHHHDHEDELFFVVKGRLRMDYRDEQGAEQQIWIEENEFIVMPHGVEHRPVAPDEVWMLLFEPAETLNTGNIQNERTKTHLDTI